MNILGDGAIGPVVGIWGRTATYRDIYRTVRATKTLHWRTCVRSTNGNRIAQGSGLGLYMMKKSASILRGDMVFSNGKEGVGSKFSLIIKL